MRVLTAAQRERFDAEGYLLVEGVLDRERDIQPVLDEYNEVFDGLARGLVAEGRLRSTYADLPFEERLVAVCEESGRNFPQEVDFSLPQSGIRTDTPIHVGPAVFAVLTNPRLLDLVEDVIGPEIFSNPVQHIRMKLPHRAVAPGSYNGLVSKIPWHQDNGVIMPEADEGTILTVWLPLNRATVANGCLQVVPHSHNDGVVQHCLTNQGVAIPERNVSEEAAVPLPMEPGSVLLMTQRTIHSSLDNVTDGEVRISMDLRYQPTGQPTGRPAFAPAGFVARSAADPASELHDSEVWAQNWYAVREQLAEDSQAFNRWKAGVDGCA